MLKLQSACPPEAKRPHYQEGYLVGSIPHTPQRYTYRPRDVAQRLVAKFHIAEAETFWNDVSNRRLSKDTLYPEDDQMKRIVDQIRERYYTMDSALQLANKLVDRLRAFQQRQDAAREAWGGLIAEVERQANVCCEVVQKALKQSENGASAAIWSEREEAEREGLTLIVFFGEQTADQEIDRKSLAIARFYVDPYTCQVVADRKGAGIPEENKRGKSGFNKSADLGDVQDISLGTFVAELLRFLEWALVGEGKGSQPWQFTDPDSS